MKNSFAGIIIINLLIAGSIVALLLLLLSWGLKVYTRHGQQISVPDLKGLTYEKAADMLDALDLHLVVMDSAYNVEKPLNTVLEQNPKAGAKVKSGRKIYVVMNASKVPTVEVPDLAGKSSLKYARLQLQSVGLVPGNLIYQPDPHLNAVIGLEVNGKPVGKGSKVPKGTVVDIVLGNGAGGEEVSVPYLIGLTLQEALFRLQGRGLKPGAIVVKSGVSDSLSAIVYKQIPAWSAEATIKTGESIDIFVADQLPEGIVVDPTLYDEASDEEVE
ncbi:MAG: PASTA domain-containing protein [Chitinophagales bacterium]|nr:PASTA domain-containing protein [Chitinophagales bacterium]MDW8273915.1 PASTA domain-containing protein [Chitinophagales bacterium]